MTIDETKKAIEVMQAFVDGKEIECKYSGGDRWAGAPVPSWAWDAFDYRVKPEPRAIWILEGGCVAFDAEEKKSISAGDPDAKFTKFVEAQ